MRALTRIGILAALAALAVGVLAATGVANPLGKGSQPEKVKVLDDFYKPTNVKIKKNKKVKWKWGQDFNSHNVTLKKGPKGVKKRSSRHRRARPRASRSRRSSRSPASTTSTARFTPTS